MNELHEHKIKKESLATPQSDSSPGLGSRHISSLESREGPNLLYLESARLPLRQPVLFLWTAREETRGKSPGTEDRHLVVSATLSIKFFSLNEEELTVLADYVVTEHQSRREVELFKEFDFGDWVAIACDNFVFHGDAQLLDLGLLILHCIVVIYF